MKLKLFVRLMLASLLVILGACNKSNDTSAANLPEGISLIEEVFAEAGKTIIPYSKYQLENGLTLIIHEDHSDPLVHIDMTYHVGSSREDLGKSGFAHFFEHMMFQGSEHVADEEHFKIVTEVGGTMNGSTNNDRTNYYETVPSNQLETMLWLEADRMGFLLDAVTQEKFEIQRETVKNERGQRIDNQPYGRLDERVSEALFPQGHPYSWPVIGYIEDLNRVNVNDLKQFFLRWYAPNNATLTIGGDVDRANTLRLVSKYFSTIPRGLDVAQPEKPLVSLSHDRYISMEDNVHLPLIYMAYPTVSARHADEAPLDVLSEVLGVGKTSLLYKNLLKQQLAVQAQATHPCGELACSFNLLALPHPASGKSLADIEAVIRASLDEFETRGVQDDDLIKAKAKMEAAFIFGLQSVPGKVSRLADNETYTGNPNFIEQDIARYNNVTKADVMRVFKTYIKDKHGVIMRVVPNGKLAEITHKDTFIRPAQEYPVSALAETSEIIIRRPQDDFDRSQQPISSASVQAALPEIWRHEMKNGIRILGTRSTETPTTTVMLKIPAGHYFETTDKAGTAGLLAAILNESTQHRSTEEMSNALDKLGATIAIHADNTYITVLVSSLTKHIDAAMELAKEKLFQPAFLEEDYTRRRNQTIEAILNNKKDAGYLAATAYRYLRYGNNIAGMPDNGDELSLARITLPDLKAFYAEHFKPAGAQVIVVSSRNKTEILGPIAATLGQWQGIGPRLDLPLPVPSHDKQTIYLVNKDRAVQSEIRIGKRALKADFTGEYYRLGLMNFPLGGHFNSRINLNLREDKGYTYGASSRFSGDTRSGSYTASAAVKADMTDQSIREFVMEIKAYHENGITTEELAYLKKAINQRHALKYETPTAKLGFLAQILEYDLTPGFVRQQAEIVKTMTAAEINKLASQHLNLDDMFIVVVGDALLLRPKLEAMGYTVKDFILPSSDS